MKTTFDLIRYDGTSHRAYWMGTWKTRASAIRNQQAEVACAKKSRPTDVFIVVESQHTAEILSESRRAARE